MLNSSIMRSKCIFNTSSILASIYTAVDASIYRQSLGPQVALFSDVCILTSNVKGPILETLKEHFETHKNI